MYKVGNGDNNKKPKVPAPLSAVLIDNPEDLLMYIDAMKEVRAMLNKVATNAELNKVVNEISQKINSIQNIELFDILAITNALHSVASGTVYTVCMLQYNDRDRCIKLTYYLNLAYINYLAEILYNTDIEELKKYIKKVDKEGKIKNVKEYLKKIRGYIQ